MRFMSLIGSPKGSRHSVGALHLPTKGRGIVKQTDRLGYLASSSFIALMLGGMPAAAGCLTLSGGGGTTVAGATSGICVTNGIISGNLVNSHSGSISPSGIKFTNGTVSGALSSAGTIVGGISLDLLSKLSNIVIDGGSFAGGIINRGTIGGAAIHTAVRVQSLPSFSGGISNSGSIAGLWDGIAVASVLNFSGGISNSGTISVGTYGIYVIVVPSFSGGITNSGTITGLAGIDVGGVFSFGGGITNSGSIDASYGIILGNLSSFSGGISNSGTISAGSHTAIRIAGVSTFSGGISNSGRISAGGVGIVLGVVSTSSSSSCCHVGNFSNGNILNSGTISANTGIQLANVGTFDGNIVNAGTISGANGIVIAPSVSFTPASAIINSGTIIGTLAAIDASAATSPVTIDQTGGLISGAIKLSNNADVLNISGGTISGNIIGQGSSNTLNFNLGSGTFTYDAAYQFTGINQVNVNSGLAILDGTNSATNVTVNGGTLEVGDASHASATLTAANGIDVLGGTLAGHGTVAGNVNIASGGTLRPGGSIGTLTIDGDLTFNAGSSYTIDLSPTQHSQTNVIGTVTINGGSVVLTPQLGTYAANRIAILTSTGALTGAFSPTVTYSSSVSLNGASLSYDGHDVYLSNLYSVVGGSPPPNGGPPPPIVVTLALPSNAPLNAQNAAGVLNNFILAGGTVPGGFQNLTNLSGNALNTAANQLGGQGQGAFAPLGFAAGNQFLGLMLNPYVEGRGAGFGPAGAAPLAYVSEEASAPAARAFNALALDGPTSGPQAVFAPRLSIWSSAYGGSGSITGNGFTGAASTDSQIYGVATGLDYLVEPNTVVGLALGGGGTAWQSGQGMGSGHSSMFQGGIYGTSRLGPAYVSGAFAYAQQDVTTNRVATLAGYDVLQGNFTANVVSGRLESGYRLPYGFLAVTPYGAVQTQAMFLPAYSEHAAVGSSQFALSYTSRTFDATRTEAGAWLDSDYFMSQGVKLYGRLAWAHDFDNEGLTTATFQSLSGSAFVINSVKPAHDGALVTAGFEYRLIDGWSVLGKFDGEYSATTAIFAGTGTLRKVW